MTSVRCLPFTTTTTCNFRKRLATRPLRSHGLPVLAAFKLIDNEGRSSTHTKPQCSVGSAPGSDVLVHGQKVASQHALIIQKGKQTFLKPLVGEALLDDDSRCWKDGVALRPGVMYVLASGSQLAFGAEDQSLTIEFEEGPGSNPLVEMMMKGMAAGSSPEVKKALGRL